MDTNALGCSMRGLPQPRITRISRIGEHTACPPCAGASRVAFGAIAERISIFTTNGATGMSDIEGKTARVAASEAGAEEVSMNTNGVGRSPRRTVDFARCFMDCTSGHLRRDFRAKRQRQKHAGPHPVRLHVADQRRGEHRRPSLW